MASASDHRAHAALQPADCLILLPQRLPAAVETSIGPAHYPAECTQSDAFLQPSLRARNGRANSDSFADSPLEEAVSSELVSDARKFPASREFTGNFIESGLRGAPTAAKTGIKSEAYGTIPYAFRTGNFLRPCREFESAIREISALIRVPRSRPLCWA